MSTPYLVKADDDFAAFTPIEPRFPNWKKSFISGHGSTLFQVQHYVHSTNENLFLTRAKFSDSAEGPPACVHGGASSAILDEVMGIAVWHQGMPSVTEKLEIHYRKFLPLKSEAWVYTEVVAKYETRIEVHATMYAAEANTEIQNDKTPRVSALGVFHRLSAEQIALFQLRLGTTSS